MSLEMIVELLLRHALVAPLLVLIPVLGTVLPRLMLALLRSRDLDFQVGHVGVDQPEEAVEQGHAEPALGVREHRVQQGQRLGQDELLELPKVQPRMLQPKRLRLGLARLRVVDVHSPPRGRLEVREGVAARRRGHHGQHPQHDQDAPGRPPRQLLQRGQRGALLRAQQGAAQLLVEAGVGLGGAGGGAEADGGALAGAREASGRRQVAQAQVAGGGGGVGEAAGLVEGQEGELGEERGTLGEGAVGEDAEAGGEGGRGEEGKERGEERDVGDEEWWRTRTNTRR